MACTCSGEAATGFENYIDYAFQVKQMLEKSGIRVGS